MTSSQSYEKLTGSSCELAGKHMVIRSWLHVAILSRWLKVRYAASPWGVPASS